MEQSEKAVECTLCGRVLKDKRSIEREYGPACREKVQAEKEGVEG